MQKAVASFVRRRRPRLPGRHLFIGAWVRSPRAMGSVTPSSRFLSKKIAAQVDIHRTGWVIELGAGTGTVTKALLDAGVKPERLLAIELDRRMSNHLQQHLPNIRVLRADATCLQDILQREHIHKINTIVCCLPLLTLPREVVDGVLEQIFAVLPEDGTMVQYTYGPRSPVTKRQLKRLGLKARRAGRVLLNVPPATVWCYTRQFPKQ